MLRPFSIVTIVTGLAAAISLACSDAAAPRTGTFSDVPGASSRGSQGSAQSPTLTEQQSNTTVRLFAVSPVNSRVVWASGNLGTYLRTTDGGEHWQASVMPGAENLQFRDVEAVSARVAYLLAAGSGTDSRIYKTEDGGKSWRLQFQNQDPNGFYDCFDFWNPRHGITFADAVPAGDGLRFPVIKTRNGGRTWDDIGDRLPTPQPGEAGFAASGTCVTTQGDRRAWIGTGGGTRARILATADAGNTWSSNLVPLPFTQGTPTSGVVSVDFRDRFRGILGGGDVATEVPQVNVARSRDGGASWEITTPAPFTGAVFGLSYVPGQRKQTVVATGPGGAAWTPNEGDTWSLLPGIANCWAVAFASRKAGWLVCGAGRIVKVSFGGKNSDDDKD
jgi:photosystem II stability/assembly factor-like uncharacterized protein